MDDVESRVNEAADAALTNAMYRYTFGIVGNGIGGVVGQGIGTGVGVCWKGTYLIVTAAHTMQTTPNQSQFFLLPDESVNIQGSSLNSEPPPVNVQGRVQLESQQSLLDDDRDLAAFIVPEQMEEQGRRHFYNLDDGHNTFNLARKQIGFLGYPSAARQQVGSNFMATPYGSFGDLVDAAQGVDSDSQVAVSYPASNSVNAHGLSGCGLWMPEEAPEAKLWTPGVILVGLVTDLDPKSQILIGYRVEELVDFLRITLP